MRNRLRRGAATALSTVALVAASLSAGTATASAAPARAAGFTTPYYGMNCTTWVSGSLGGYYGNAQCAGVGQWYLQVSCTAGFTYNSSIALQLNSWDVGTRSAGSCYWGVSSMQVREIPA